MCSNSSNSSNSSWWLDVAGQVAKQSGMRLWVMTHHFLLAEKTAKNSAICERRPTSYRQLHRSRGSQFISCLRATSTICNLTCRVFVLYVLYKQTNVYGLQTQFVREAFKKKSQIWDIVRKWEGGLKNHKLFFQNLVWTFFNRGGGFCHHVQTVKS